LKVTTNFPTKDAREHAEDMLAVDAPVRINTTFKQEASFQPGEFDRAPPGHPLSGATDVGGVPLDFHRAIALPPVDYLLGGRRWDWVPEFGQRLERWYPSPMTMGRLFDYHLLRRHGLANAREGAPQRGGASGARYLVTHAFEPPPVVLAPGVRQVELGRYCVTVLP